MEKELNLLEPDAVQKQLEEEVEGEKYDELSLSDLDYIGLSPSGEIFNFKDKDYIATPELLEMLLTRIKVPGKFFSQCSHLLKSAILNEFLESSKMNAKMIYDEKKLRGLISIEMPYVSVLSVFSTVREMIPEAKIQFSQKIGGNYIFNWVTNISAAPVKKVGDITRGGVTLEIGLPGYVDRERFGSNVQVGGFLYRLACLNGVITKNEQIVIVKGISEADILSNLKELVHTTLSAVKEQFLPQFVHLDDVPVRDPAQVVHQIGREVKVSQALQSRILDRLPSLGQNPSYYSLINLITSFANEWSPKRARRLQRLGGEIAISEEHRCPTCKNWLR